MSATAPTVRDAKPDEVLAALPGIVGTKVQPGASEWDVARNYYTDHATVEQRISFRDDDGVWNRRRVGLALLRRMVKDGLIAQHPYATQGRGAKFTTLEMSALIAAETALSDAERAERTAAAIAERFDENVRDYGDRIWRQPVDTSYGWLPTDGLREALDVGLVVEVQTGSKPGFVPAAKVDAWREAFEAERDREQRHKDHVAARVARLLELCPRTERDRRVVELDLGQVDWLIGALSHLQGADL